MPVDPLSGGAHLIVRAGVRGILSFLGIVTLYAGVWHVDRTWDEKGSAAYKRVAGESNADAGGGDTENQATAVKIPEEDLDAAFPFPWAFILGWVMFGASYLFDNNSDDFPKADKLGPSIICLIISLAMSFIASVPMGNSVRNRNGPLKMKLGLMFLLGWILLSIFSGFDGDWKLKNQGLNMALCFIGAISIIASMKLLWKYRKMGDSWEQEGRPNPNPIVYNAGLPLFAMGWFVFWLGQSSVSQQDATFFHQFCGYMDCGMPFFFNAKAILAYFAGCGMVPVVLFMDYAHDEGSEYVGCGTEGKYWGRFLESPIPFLTMWTLLGFTSFIDGNNDVSYGGEPRSWVLLVICMLQGIVAGVIIQTYLYKGDMQGKNRGSMGFLFLWLCLIVNSAFTPDYSGLNAGGLTLGCMIPGVICVVAGQITVFGDRKRGDYWMQNDQKPNPNPVVYSPGEALFMFGWILIAQGMALDNF